MSESAILFGDILDPAERRKLEQKCAGTPVDLQFVIEPNLPDSAANDAQIIVDLDNPTFTDPTFLVALARLANGSEVVGSTRNSTLDVAHFAKLGISRVLSPEDCLSRLHQLLERLESDAAAAADQLAHPDLYALVGSSGWMKEIQSTVAALAEVDFPMALLLGETGTGKSLVSKVLHNAGTRRDHHLVEVNCSAIPDELFESELFGHVQGAFTDAKSDKKGLFEFADNGTLFLDEVGDLSVSAQAKLLKVLEDKKLRRVGDVVETDVNVRVLAATNRDLEEAVANGQFRQDLFYRLNMLCITVPPLREHPEDIPDLTRHYLAFYGTNYNKPNLNISAATLKTLGQYHWPGNVRQLCNVIERAVLLNTSGTIEAEDIDIAVEKDRLTAAERQRIEIDIPPQGKSLKEIEVEVVKQVLNMVEWNRTRAAQYLGISRPRLRRILDSGQLESDRREE